MHRRGYVHRQQSSPTRYEPDPEPSAENVQNAFVGHALSAFNNLRKVFVYAGYGTIVLALVTATAFEGAHFWIERQMRAVHDEDAEQWGWQPESWTGSDADGTSPALGFFGRHAVRAAWFSQRYGTCLGGTTAISQVHGSRDTGSLNVVESSLESTRVYLETAMMRVRDEHGRVRDDRVGLDLLERHAAVLERIGSREALVNARDEYRQVFQGSSGRRIAEARLAVKLGDLSERLGDSEDALSWWAQGIQLTKDCVSMNAASAGSQSQPAAQGTVTSAILAWTRSKDHGSSDPESILDKLILPAHPPSDPAAQRTLAAAMLSLSAYYSKRKLLSAAKYVQERAISLIEAMVPTLDASVAPVAQSPGQTLHQLYLLHRKSVLAIHHGEVTFSLASDSIQRGAPPFAAPLTELVIAASSSEVVAQVLTGLSLSHPDIPSSYLRSNEKSTAVTRVLPPPSPNAALLPMFQDSALSATAGSLLRDARLTAVEAWDLCGVLYSDWGKEETGIKALECFERALGWAGEPGNGSRNGMGVNAWQSLWERFVEARRKVIKERPLA